MVKIRLFIAAVALGLSATAEAVPIEVSYVSDDEFAFGEFAFEYQGFGHDTTLPLTSGSLSIGGVLFSGNALRYTYGPTQGGLHVLITAHNPVRGGADLRFTMPDEHGLDGPVPATLQYQVDDRSGTVGGTVSPATVAEPLGAGLFAAAAGVLALGRRRRRDMFEQA